MRLRELEIRNALMQARATIGVGRAPRGRR
jgi:hypothetical protein